MKAEEATAQEWSPTKLDTNPADLAAAPARLGPQQATHCDFLFFY